MLSCKAEGNHHIALCYPQNYSQYTSLNTTNSDQNNNSITLPADEQTAFLSEDRYCYIVTDC